jgi:hypothetical protein
MARPAVVSADLKVGISQLGKQWKALNTAYEDFARKKIQFAQEVSRIWHKAKELDKDVGSDVNQNHFRQQLRDIIQSDNQSILSRWVSIGSHAKELLPYANSLPPQRDSLYELSKVPETKKNIQKWIDSGRLSTESTVREVKSLLTNKKSKKTAATKQRTLSVTLEFDCNYEGAARMLSSLICEDHVTGVRSDKSFVSALAEKLGQEDFQKIASKVKQS